MNDKDDPAEPQPANLPENPYPEVIISRTTAPSIRGRKQHLLDTRGSRQQLE